MQCPFVRPVKGGKMAVFLYLCILVLSFYETKSKIIGAGLFCRDPDTGKLYAANTTWASTTFCGNYTCKLTKKLAKNSKPIRVLNITKIDSSHEKYKNADGNVKNNIDPVIVEEKTVSDVQTVLHKNSVNDETSKDKDRYLTADEIKKITELLHTVKKSDLDAIVEIYNLAQDIYKEMDKAVPEDIAEETIDSLKEINKAFKDYNVKTQHPSYWYDSLESNMVKPDNDLDLQGSDIVTTTVETKRDQNADSYFKGPLTDKDFGKLPYYYPVSDFQRMSSYIYYPTYKPPTIQYTKPCNKQSENVRAPWINRLVKKPFQVESQKMIQPSYLLPYPFYHVHRSNNTDNNLFANPWIHFDLSKYQNPNVDTANIQIPSNLQHDGNTKDHVTKESKSNRPDWMTDPLPDSVIKEVKANIDKSIFLNPFPLRKKVFLEKVGKVVKLDDLSRSKRNIVKAEPEADDEYEVHVESTQCDTEIELGFFRHGNSSQPYPDCCPQKIITR